MLLSKIFSLLKNKSRNISQKLNKKSKAPDVYNALVYSIDKSDLRLF